MPRRMRITNAATGRLMYDLPEPRTAKAASPAPPAATPPPATQAAGREVSAQTAARVKNRLEAEELIDRAVHGGVINEGYRAHYVAAYAADPAATRAYLAALGMRDVSVTQAGTADDSDAYPDSFLTVGERKQVSAAREGRVPRIIR